MNGQSIPLYTPTHYTISTAFQWAYNSIHHIYDFSNCFAHIWWNSPFTITQPASISSANCNFFSPIRKGIWTLLQSSAYIFQMAGGIVLFLSICCTPALLCVIFTKRAGGFGSSISVSTSPTHSCGQGRLRTMRTYHYFCGEGVGVPANFSNGRSPDHCVRIKLAFFGRSWPLPVPVFATSLTVSVAALFSFERTIGINL